MIPTICRVLIAAMVVAFVVGQKHQTSNCLQEDAQGFYDTDDSPSVKMDEYPPGQDFMSNNLGEWRGEV